tara:strand:+ start:16161 stop:16421 length:261 start_codon:yes stop_codon:yes gene_type:complete
MFSTKPEFIKISLAAAIIGALLNVTLSFIVMPFATEDQISPPSGAANLPYYSQLIHMLVHHNQVPITSSLIVFIVAFLSTNLSLSL